MSSFLKNRKIRVLRTAFYLVTAFSLSACSTSMDRFSEYPDVNTASLPDQSEQNSAVQQNQPDTANRPQQQAWQNAPVTQQTTYTRDQPVQQPYGGAGQVIVQSGQTLYSIARANNLTAGQLAQANTIAPPYTVRVGQVLRIPGTVSPPAPQPQVQATNQPVDQQNFSQGGMHVVRPGETLFAVGRAYNVHPFTIADHNGLSHDVALKAGQRLRIPGGESAQAPVQQQAFNSQVKQQQQSATGNLDPQQLPEPPGKVVHEQVGETQVQSQQLAADAVAGGFRWPVRGRIISTFGEKPSGMRNEGINISVPEGTSVKAAESGIVAYAGNELKGYGNLVLIRHENGWVTAYAHNRELFVKRGDTVRRGDIIAKAGQTGSVTSPQLHFEVRKGPSAVDPIKYLGSEQAAN